VTIDVVVEYLHRNAALAQQIIREVLPQVPSLSGCSCHSALATAILTDRAHWPAKTRAMLKPILAQHLKR